MKPTRHAVLAALAAAALVACPAIAQDTMADEAPAAVQAGEPVEVDLSSPKATVKTMASAASAGDAEAFKKTIDLRDEAVKEVFDTVSPMLVSMMKMGAAGREAFGEEAMAGGGMGGMGAPDFAALSQLVDDATVEENGDTATLTIEEVPEELQGQIDPASLRPMQLVKVDGDWLLDASAMGLSAQEVDPAEMEQMKQVMPMMAGAVDEVTAGIKAGEYATAEAAQQALQQKMMQTMMQAQQQMMDQQGGMEGGNMEGGDAGDDMQDDGGM